MSWRDNLFVHLSVCLYFPPCTLKARPSRSYGHVSYCLFYSPSRRKSMSKFHQNTCKIDSISFKTSDGHRNVQSILDVFWWNFDILLSQPNFSPFLHLPRYLLTFYLPLKCADWLRGSTQWILFIFPPIASTWAPPKIISKPEPTHLIGWEFFLPESLDRSLRICTVAQMWFEYQHLWPTFCTWSCKLIGWEVSNHYIFNYSIVSLHICPVASSSGPSDVIYVPTHLTYRTFPIWLIGGKVSDHFPRVWILVAVVFWTIIPLAVVFGRFVASLRSSSNGSLADHHNSTHEYTWWWWMLLKTGKILNSWKYYIVVTRNRAGPRN